MDLYQSYYTDICDPQSQCVPNDPYMQSNASYVYANSRAQVNNSYTNFTTLPTSIPSGGQPIPISTVILPGVAALPISNSVTLIQNYSDFARNNNLNLYPLNGIFLIPYYGQYNIVVSASFSTPISVGPTDYREIGIYKIAKGSGLTSSISMSTQHPIIGTSSNFNLSTVVNLDAADRIFIAARQFNASGLGIDVLAGLRLTIERI